MAESPLARMATRAASIPLGNSGSPNGKRKLTKPALGNLDSRMGTSGGGLAATQSVTYTSQGQPLTLDWSADEMSKQAYMGQVYVQRGCRLIAETIAQLPWVAGPDPTDPGNYDKQASLSVLLGPSTPQAPGGPNPNTASRTFWSWSIIQYIVTGRWGWEVEYAPATGRGKQRTQEILGLWPLVSAALTPVPTIGQKGAAWFDGFEYKPATGKIRMPADKVIYCWRPSINDWRLPESMLSSAAYPIYIANAINKYMANLLKNDLVATTLVATPPIEEPEFRRAWQDQFLSKFTGVQNVGKTLFAEFEYDEDDKSGKPLIQIERLAQTPLDAGLMQMLEVAKEDICIDLGVPKSLMGDASGRTFSNVDGEWRNFWTTTLLNLITELQDQINLNLAPRLDGGANVGWFDLSRIEALQPPAVFSPPLITEAIQTGIATPEQIAAMLNIPPAPDDAKSVQHPSTNTIERGDPSLEYRHDLDPVILRGIRTEIMKQAGHNTWTYRGERKRKEFQRERITTSGVRSTSGKGFDQAAELTRKANDVRALALTSRRTETVRSKLAEVYPTSTLGWVDNTDWAGPKEVPLEDIQMAQRPGGRDQSKVQSIAAALAEDPKGPAGAPVILVKTPDGSLKVADGYHRTLAHKRLDHSTVLAYVGTVDDEHGPWDEEMYENKLNRADSFHLDPFDVLDERSMADLEALADEYVLAGS